MGSMEVLTVEPTGRIVLLTVCSGSMDALSFLELGHVFTSAMTGNTVLLGLAMGQGLFLDASRSATALGGFLLGVVIATWTMYDADWNVDWPPSVTTVFTIEMVLLGAFWLDRLWFGLHMSYGLYSLIALAAVAMGMQSAAVRQLDVPGIMTTFLTGTLTSLLGGLIHSTLRQSAPPSPVTRQAVVYLTYLGSVMGAGFLMSRDLAAAAAIPFCTVLMVVAWAHRMARMRGNG